MSQKAFESGHQPCTIRQMHPSDLDFAAYCTMAEGWISETREDFVGFFTRDPGGCLIAELDGQLVGIGVATWYGETGFVGELIVIPELRGQEIGRALLDRAVEYLRGRGARSILLDGVVKAAPLYERAGFRKICRSLRFMGSMEGREHPEVRPMWPGDISDVCELDEQAFGADRRFFLRRRLALHPELSKVLVQDGEIRGYIMGRRRHEWATVGPWIVQQGIEQPERLLESLAVELKGIQFGLGVLDTHARAVEIVRSLGFEERADSPWRMALGEPGNPGGSPLAYAVGSAAKG